MVSGKDGVGLKPIPPHGSALPTPGAKAGVSIKERRRS